MPTRITYIIIVALAAIMLVSVDRLEVQQFSRHQRESLVRVSFDVTTHFRNFFQARLNATKAAARLMGDSSDAVGGNDFPGTADAIFSSLRGVRRVSLLDADLNAVSSWTGATEDSEESSSVVPDRRALKALAEKALDTDDVAVSGALPLPDGDYSFVVVQPVKAPGKEPTRLIAGEFRVWQAEQRLLRARPARHYFIFLEDPSGAKLLQRELLPYDGPERKGTFSVGDDKWTVHVRPPARAMSGLLVARLVLWGLGLVLIFSFLLFYFLLAEKNAELEENYRILTTQTRAVQESNHQLVQVNKELDDFTYVVAHDLKEPLRGIEGLTKLLLGEYGKKLDDTVVEYLRFVRNSGGRMRRLVNDLLHLSRIARRRYPCQKVNFNELIQEVLETLAFAVAEKSAKVSVPPDLPMVPCDRVRMSEVFQNLLSNAIKFSNGRVPEIEIGHEERAEEHLFWVQDNGMGISPEDLERVFQIFQRCHAENNSEGTGVGLTVCKRIIERHGGRIWVKSEPGTGSRFCFTLRKEPPGWRPSDSEPRLGEKHE